MNMLAAIVLITLIDGLTLLGVFALITRSERKGKQP